MSHLKSLKNAVTGVSSEGILLMLPKTVPWLPSTLTQCPWEVSLPFLFNNWPEKWVRTHLNIFAVLLFSLKYLPVTNFTSSGRIQTIFYIWVSFVNVIEDQIRVNNRKNILQNRTHGIKQAIKSSGMTNLPVHNELSKLIKWCYFGPCFLLLMSDGNFPIVQF